jgi:hypothetical protein
LSVNATGLSFAAILLAMRVVLFFSAMSIVLRTSVYSHRRIYVPVSIAASSRVNCLPHLPLAPALDAEQTAV